MKSKRPISLSVAALLLAFVLGACSNNSVEPEGQISPEARDEALNMTADALQADQSMATAQTVEMLTGGFADGIGDESAGLQVELGDQIQLNSMTAETASIGRRLIDSRDHLQKASAKLRIHMQDAQKSDPLPGDLLFRYSETNLDGSVTVVSVYQDSPLAVVKVEFVTQWPAGNLLLHSASETVYVDRGANYDDESDDIWLSYEGELIFAGGASLLRSIDERANGGIQDDSRVELVSRYRPRPNAPRLLEIRTVLEIDIHVLANENDDRFVSAERRTSFRGVAHDGGSPRVVENFMPQAPLAEGEEPCGGELSRAVYFRLDRRLASWTDSAQWACEGGGQLRRDISFAGGSRAYVQLTEQLDGIVALDALDRDGTQTTGSFDEAAGRFEINTVYPAGGELVSRAIQGQTLSNGWELDEQISYDDGFVELNHLKGIEDANGKELSGSHDGRDESLSFVFTSNADETMFTGQVENDKNQSFEFAIEVYEDGGRSVNFTAIDNEITVVGELMVDAEGCGEGFLLVTEGANSVRIEVSFCDRQLVDEDEGIAISL